jgi:hypothetical protein
MRAARVAQLRNALPGNRYGNLSPQGASMREAVHAAWLEKK